MLVDMSIAESPMSPTKQFLKEPLSNAFHKALENLQLGKDLLGIFLNNGIH
jgi:hypothetical protein